jgi:hypothetical protein
MHRVTLGCLLIAALGVPAAAGEARRPRVELRATPRMAFIASDVLVAAQLVGGDEHEDFYCPELEWEFGDGSRSRHQADCEPFQPGTPLERRFTSRHVYRRPGDYEVRVTLRRSNRALAVATTRVRVYFGSAVASQ